MPTSNRGRNLARVPDQPTNTDFMSAINSTAVEAKLSAADCKALVETIRATDGWFAQQVGDLHHRYVFCWRWKEPSTAVLFCWDEASWLALRARIEKALGLRR
jgi:isoleucyl-tRNA synthetase